MKTALEKVNALYKEIDFNMNFSDMDREILSFWKENNTFKKSITGKKDYIFYDGPPFANGLPHYGHLLTGYIKDTIGRFHAMKGEKVERRFGWDCHGLPAEMDVEKTLKISGRKAIQEYGIENFNNKCRSTVLKYTKEWEEYVTRQGRWVDFHDDYKTMDINYMETVIWIFKQLYDKGLIYRSMRVMPYSWACETPVSDFETRIDNCYREKISQSITVSFILDVNTLKDEIRQNTSDIRILVWTTTPWTLPSNLALAVGREIQYSILAAPNGITYIIASNLIGKYTVLADCKLIAECNGEDLIGAKYQPLFQYYAGHKNAFQILAGDFVSTEDGTGIVHIAPGFGEDDYEICRINEIDVVCPVDDKGCFDAGISDYAGMQVFDANEHIIKFLKKNGLLISIEQYAHNYPHCWRTDTPLIYRAISSWYVKVTAIKDSLIKNNQKINWIPGHIKDNLFGKWLENARDWSISRNRYWGCPIPVWVSDDDNYPHIEVYGSLAEIENSFNVKVDDLHKPFIDTLTKPNPSDPTGKSKLVRVPDVLDCWFESGAMPYAQLHYPFENKEHFEKNFPADFIVEYIAQTRGWFYTLHVLSCALFDKPAFLNCICHGVLLGEDKQKLSKRARNYIDPLSVFEKFGSDAMRFFMLSSNVMQGQAMVIDANAECVMNVVKNVIKPIWSGYHFFSLYANIDRVQGRLCIDERGQISSEITSLLDKYIITKCINTVQSIDKALSDYDTIAASNSVQDLIEVLNNWYIRRSRERFWRSEINKDKISAYNTLYTVLYLLCVSSAPLLPFISEYIYLALYNNQTGTDKTNESVHLLPFPKLDSNLLEAKLLDKMDSIRKACHATLHIRNRLKIRIRQPLASVTLIGIAEDINDELENIVLDEINVHECKNLPITEVEKYADSKLQLNLKEIGKRLGDKVQNIIRDSKEGKWTKSNDGIIVCGATLSKNEYSIAFNLKEEFKERGEIIDDGRGIVLLDTKITKELEIEGMVRDIVRFVQQMRKEMKFDITDNIRLKVTVYDDYENIRKEITASKWIEYIKKQTLSSNLLFEEGKGMKTSDEENTQESKLLKTIYKLERMHHGDEVNITIEIDKI